MIEYLANNMWQAWAVIAIICLILEMSSGDFFIMSFAIGAAVAGLTSLLGNIYLQLIVFAVATALSIFFVRPFALRYLHKGDDTRVSNADAIIGRCGRVTQTIEKDGYGRVAIDGDDWKAEAADGVQITVGTKVEVVARESIIIRVREINKAL